MDMLRVRSVQPLADYWLRLTLTDDSVVERDVRALLRGPVFEPLRSDYGKFERSRVRWGTVTWAGGLDLDPDVLIWGGPPPGDSEALRADKMVLTPPVAAARA
jgi:Protein of unknown function (DUF2442)